MAFEFDLRRTRKWSKWADVANMLGRVFAQAEGMTGIHRVWVWVQRMLRVMDERNLGLIAAGVAFYAILSVFPGLAAVIALSGVIGDPGLILSLIHI